MHIDGKQQQQQQQQQRNDPEKTKTTSVNVQTATLQGLTAKWIGWSGIGITSSKSM
ncbi:MAG: hypothetical protein M3261_04425 [Thermoproteota archaeon]|nr:hypothetical protein [Thermoproteota archaeon]